MLTAGTVKEAFNLLAARARSGNPFSLILTDMNLPDGTGLDVIREVRSSPYWRLTPVIVLSSEIAPGTIDSAYALGANCYLSKISSSKGVLESLKSLYECWMEEAVLPQVHPENRMQGLLKNGISLRARTADFYMKLARSFGACPDEADFWLDRALYEGNIANLLANFRERLGETKFPSELMDRIDSMQINVRETLAAIEKESQAKSTFSSDEICLWVLNILESIDEEIFADSIGLFFPIEPVAAVALKLRAAGHLREVATYVLDRTKKTILCERAEKLLEWSHQLEKK
jgi:CheY-like chemotaxis protein